MQLRAAPTAGERIIDAIPATMEPVDPLLSDSRARVEHFDTLIVGGGQAGLAVGRHLAARDLDFVILDREARVGDRHRAGGPLAER